MAGVGPCYVREHDVRPRGAASREPVVLCSRVARASRLGVCPDPAHLLELGVGGQGELVAEPEAREVLALAVVSQRAALEADEAGDGDEAGVGRARRGGVGLRASLVIPSRSLECSPSHGSGLSIRDEFIT